MGKHLASADTTVTPLDDGTRVVMTIHPSALLRMREEAEKRAAYAAFVRDLKIAAKPVFGKARKAASPSLLA